MPFHIRTMRPDLPARKHAYVPHEKPRRIQCFNAARYNQITEKVNRWFSKKFFYWVVWGLRGCNPFSIVYYSSESER